jgi:hypothetical protein
MIDSTEQNFRVAELADAPDLKTLGRAFSTTSETYQKLPKISFKPTTGADFSPISEAKTGKADENS